MPRSCTHVYVHLVWATWDREPLITPSLEEPLYGYVTEKCRELQCEPLALGGTEDHVHLLVRLHSTVPVAELVKAVKGASSHLVSHVYARDGRFKWQGTYGAFSVGLAEVERVRQYIRRQKEHHRAGDLQPDWERCQDIEVTERIADG
jgi:putative transposase